MAGEQQMQPVAELLLIVNFCIMYVVVLGIGGRAMNRAIFDHGFIIGPRFDLLAHFSPIYFSIGNAATGFFVLDSRSFWCCIRNITMSVLGLLKAIVAWATQLTYIAAAIHGAASR